MFSGVCVFSNTGGSAFTLLRNVTSGSFLEADQPREINVPLQPHACSVVLQRIIDEECDIMQKHFRFHRINCPQLNRRDFRRNQRALVRRRKQSCKSRLSKHWRRRIMGLLICNLSAQRGSISGWVWFAFPLYFDIQATLHKRIKSFLNTFLAHTFLWSLMKSIRAVFDPSNTS